MKTPDIQKTLRAHVRISAHTLKWAKRGLNLAKSGRMADAKRAAAKAEVWFAKLAKLESMTMPLPHRRTGMKSRKKGRRTG